MTIEPGQRRAGKRGKLPPRPDGIKLKFGDYLKRDKLPALPPRFGHVSNIPPGRHGWGMLGNDVAGDCVIAGRCHEIMVDALATHRPVPDFSSGSALAAYSACLVYGGGQPFDPRNPETDTGLDMQQAAKWWRDVGLTDADGRIHKIDAYVAIETVDDVLMAAYLCGAAGVGLALPATAETQFEAGQVWDDLKGEPIGGHYVPCVGLMGGHLVFVTWGELQGATKDYVAKWIEDGVCCLSREYMGANNLSPELIDWAALLDDVDAIAAADKTPVSAHMQAARHQPPMQRQPEQREHDAEHGTDQRAEESIQQSEPESQPAKPHRKRQPDHKPKRKPTRKPR
jgi:hypothetical protein